MKFFLPFSVLVFTLLACSPTPKKPQLWFFTYGRTQAGSSDTKLTPASFLYLNEEGHYTRDFGNFDYGTWTLGDDTLSLRPNGSAADQKLAISFKGQKEMLLKTTDGTEVFELHPAAPSKNENPFSVSNNKWRVRPLAKESDAALRERLKNHCQFWESYFTWALDGQLQYLDVRSTPTSIKIYGNGFGLKPLKELPAAWKQCFFDDEDCEKASMIVEDIFREKTIGMPQTDSKYKMFISAFQQLRRSLEDHTTVHLSNRRLPGAP